MDAADLKNIVAAAILTAGSPVPEPSTYALALAGGAGLLGVARLRQCVARLRV